MSRLGRAADWVRSVEPTVSSSSGDSCAAAGDETSKAPTGSHRAAQDVELDLQVDFDALHYESSDLRADNRPTGLTPEWDWHPRVDWSRRVGKSWDLDPVLLHRRQAGQPDQPGNHLSNKTIGIEMRRRF